MAVFAFFILALPTRSAYAFTYNGQEYPNSIAGVTVTMNSQLSDPYDVPNEHEWYTVRAFIQNSPNTNKDVNYFYLENSAYAFDVGAHPWWFSGNHILSTQSTDGTWFAFDGYVPNITGGDSLGWWGTNNNDPPTITFYPAQDQPFSSDVTDQYFIRYVVDNSDYRQRYSVSSGNTSLSYPANGTWTPGTMTYNQNTRTVNVYTSLGNGTAWSAIVWVVRDAGTTVWQFPIGLSSATGPDFYGTQSFQFSVVVPDDVYGNLRVRWYYKTTANASQQTQTSDVIAVTAADSSSPLNPGSSASQKPYFGEVTSGTFGHYSEGQYITAYVYLAEEVTLEYASDNGYVYVGTFKYYSSGGYYDWTGVLPSPTAEYYIVATNDYGSVRYKVGTIEGAGSVPLQIIDIFGSISSYVQNFFTYMSSFWGWLPPELSSFLTVAIMAMVVLGAVQLIKP